jgi:hypothetical protein
MRELRVENGKVAEITGSSTRACFRRSASRRPVIAPAGCSGLFHGLDEEKRSPLSSPAGRCARTGILKPLTVRAPKANAIAERFVRTVRSECLDWLLVLNRRHLERVLRVYVNHYNRERPHRALELGRPSRTSDEKEPPKAKFAVATGSAASSTSTTEPPHEKRHD